MGDFVLPGTTKSPHDKPDLSAIRAELERLGAQGAIVELVLGLLEQMALQNNQLQWRLHTALRHLYRKKSEKISPEQLALFLSKLTDEQAALAEVAGTDTPSTASAAEGAGGDAAAEPIQPLARKPHKKPFPDHLRCEPRDVLVPEDQRRCSQCGTDKEPMGHDTRTIWEFRPAEFFKIEERLEKRVCKKCQEGVVTAEGSAKPIDGGRPGPGLLAQIATSKMRDACPLYRQSQIYRRSEILLSPSTLGDWFAATADMVEPLVLRLRERTLLSYLLSLDDTGMPVQDRDHPKGIKRGHIWTYLGDGGQVGFCEYTPTWEKDAPCAVLAEFQGKVVQADGYAGIDSAFQGLSPPRRAGCMDHCRRKWVAALDAGDARAAIVVTLIGKLYAMEAQARLDGADLDELLRRRREQSQPVMDRLRHVIADLHGTAVPKSPLGKATTYSINQWETLTVFLDDPRVPISNAHVERQQRRTALVRKNALFAGSDEGAHRLALLQTIVVNCELNDIDMFFYLRDVLAKLANSWPHSRIDDLLPDSWAANQNRQNSDTQHIAAR